MVEHILVRGWASGSTKFTNTSRENHMTDQKTAFVELAKFFLGLNHIPGVPAGMNPSKDDEIVCLDLVVNFPENLILGYLEASGQGRGDIRSLRHLAHGVVNEYYNHPAHALTKQDEYNPIIDHVKKWKKQFAL